MPVQNFQKELQMNSKNRGFSILMIVLIVALVLVISLVGFGVYAYTSNPYVVLKNASTNVSDSSKIKNISTKGSVTASMNLGELIRNSKGYKAQDVQKETEAIVKIVDKKIDYTFNINAKIDNETKTYLLNTAVKTPDLNLGEFKDMVPADGTLFDIDYAMKLNSQGVTEKYIVKLNKVINYFPMLNSGGTYSKIKLNSLTGSWVDASSTLKNSFAANQDNAPKSEEVAACLSRNLSFFENLQLAMLITNSGIEAKNLGTVEIDGKKYTKISMDLKAENKDKLADSLNKIGKLYCQDSFKGDISELTNNLFKDLGVKSINVTTFVDNQTNLIGKQVNEVLFDKAVLGTDVVIKSDVTIFDLNSTEVKMPTEVKSFEKFAEDNLSPIVRQISASSAPVQPISTASSQGSTGGGYACNVPQKEIDNFMKVCMSSEQFQDITNDIKGLCGCMVTQQRNVACSDTAGFNRRVDQYCSKYVR